MLVQRTVGDLADRQERRGFSGHLDLAFEGQTARPDEGIGGVRHIQAIQGESIAIDIGLNRTHRRRPNSFIILGHGNGLMAEFTIDADLLGIGSEQAKD
jgi:hypothetical protein